MPIEPRTVAGHPVRVEDIDLGGLHVPILVVADLERYVDREALLRDAQAPEPPYWAHLWTASRALAHVVVGQDDWNRKRVADVGCGVGLPGVVAAMKGGVVVATDIAFEALAMTRANAELNRCRVATVADDLRRSSLRGRFDRCLAADVTYDPALQRALASFLAAHLAPPGEALVAESVRIHDSGFSDACKENALQVQERSIVVAEEGHTLPVRISRVTHL